MDLPIKTQRTVKWLLALTDEDLNGYTRDQKRTIRKDCQGYIDSWENVIKNTPHQGDVVNTMKRERNLLIDLSNKLNS